MQTSIGSSLYEQMAPKSHYYDIGPIHLLRKNGMGIYLEVGRGGSVG